MELARVWSQEDQATRASEEDMEGQTIIALARSREDQERAWNEAVGMHGSAGAHARQKRTQKRTRKRARKRAISPGADDLEVALARSREDLEREWKQAVGMHGSAGPSGLVRPPSPSDSDS